MSPVEPTPDQPASPRLADPEGLPQPGLSADPAPSGSEERPLLSLHQVRKVFGEIVAVADATFAVHPARITGLIGPNGAGKSTVINIIGCQERASSGEINFRGASLARQSPEGVAKRGLARTFQTARLFSRLTVTENLLLGPLPYAGESLRYALAGKAAWKRQQDALLDRAIELMCRFDMLSHGDEYAANLSGGQKRLVEIMRALMSKPALLLLDEPMAGVSPALSRRIAEHLLALRHDGLTMLLVEHELPLVELLCNPVIVMAEGRVLAEGRLEELRGNEEVVSAYLAQ